MTIVQLRAIEENAGKLTTRQIADKIGLSYNSVNATQRRYGFPIRLQNRKYEGQEIRAGKEFRVLQAAELLCEKPLTIYNLASALDVTTRAVYRYLTLLRALGVETHLDAKGKYSLKDCPFCKKKL